MISEDTLATLTKIGIVAAVLFVLLPAAIWVLVKYVEFLVWAGNL